jgi:hypothetical protein
LSWPDRGFAVESGNDEAKVPPTTPIPAINDRHVRAIPRHRIGPTMITSPKAVNPNLADRATLAARVSGAFMKGLATRSAG